MDAYDNYAACQKITEFVDALIELVRPPQPRPLLGGRRESARQARRLLDAVRMPADDDASWSRRSCRFWPRRCGRTWPWPPSASARWRACICAIIRLARRAARSTSSLSARMGLVREIVSLGRAARMSAKLKVRQPLAKVEVILADRDAPGLARSASRAGGRGIERQAGRVPRSGPISTSATRCCPT